MGEQSSALQPEKRRETKESDRKVNEIYLIEREAIFWRRSRWIRTTDDASEELRHRYGRPPSTEGKEGGLLVRLSEWFSRVLFGD
jgi:hypothetical protein